MMYYYRMQWTAEGSVFGAVSLCYFVCVWNISGTAKRICTKFTQKMCLVLRSDEFEGQVKRSKSPGIKTAFSALLAACVQFMFGKTSLASSFKVILPSSSASKATNTFRILFNLSFSAQLLHAGDPQKRELWSRFLRVDNPSCRKMWKHQRKLQVPTT